MSLPLLGNTAIGGGTDGKRYIQAGNSGSRPGTKAV